ncbi:C2H2-type zinc finger protein [Halobacterium sp. CBA1126]|uniref:DUF7410 domain-containing protein n=1 Tax=Halobacterium TaxID=2239 RepID=UPI0012FB4230|nr:C2H2-type zinc finger protein [Halobacterium sp. CBA1126]MUV60064.1 C2H2-type zinc finger protein [Halobacterium sp. CBA1126]
MTDDTPPEDAPRCSYCGEPFPSERLRALHRGLEHYDRLDDDERAAYEDAYRAEGEDLRSFRLRALAVLVALYFGFLMLYAVVAV